MTGGLIQLVARGAQDLFITEEPQITFFKVVYRRHTNFSTEVIPQNFITKPNFGNRSTCIISRNGDLIRNVHLILVLPIIPPFRNENGEIDSLSKFAWVRRIGYALIKSVEIEIGGELIDKHYGDWLNIWHELYVPSNKEIDKLIGDIKELYEYSNGKKSYKMMIPMRFWFNRITGLALPVVNLQYENIKINVELNPIEKVSLVSPNKLITIDNDFVNFEPFEYIQQTVNNQTSIGRFIGFDIEDRVLYISRVSDNEFLSVSEQNPENLITEKQQRDILYELNDDGMLVNDTYYIKGLSSGFEAMPRINSFERSYRNNSISFKNINLKDAFLLVEYVFLDMDERVKFAQSKHEYLIEQVLYNGERTIDGINQRFKIGMTRPCKELFWVSQLSTALNTNNNDVFNYSNSLIKGNSDVSIIQNQTLIFNGTERLSRRDSAYFGIVQPFQYHITSPAVGINCYSFGVHPTKHQPSGTANLSKIDNVSLSLDVQPDISFTNTAKLRVYGVVYNVFRVANGISGLVFSNDLIL